MPQIETTSFLSPHTRGTRHGQAMQRHNRLLIPAHAGNTIEACNTRNVPASYPRTRGEHRVTPLPNGPTTFLSPHTRGTQQPRERPGRRQLLIPAHAGNTRDSAPLPAHSPSYPRTRGEHSNARSGISKGSFLSPHTRGTHCCQ